jgi:hypothetical protein
MNQDNNQPNESRESSIQDAQGPWYSHLTTSLDPSFHTTTSLSTPMENDMQTEQQMSLPSTQTISISTDDDDDNETRNEGQQQMQQMTNTLSQE